MKVIVRKSSNVASGYEMSIVDDTGVAQTTELHFWSVGKTNPRYKDTLLLPKNPANRTYFDVKQFAKKGLDEIELEYRETRVLGPYNRGVVKKDWTEYLTEEEKAQYDTIKQSCIERKKIAETLPELTKVEKLQLEIEKLTKKRDALLNK